MKNRNRVYYVTVLLIVIDQLAKILVQRNMTMYKEIKIIPNFFSLCYVENTGAAFSILEDSTLLLIIISVIFVVFLDKYIKKEADTLNKLSIIAYGMIMGGIFGNLIDRILNKSVIDFLAFKFGSYNFPIFNIADIGITVGVALVFLDMILKRKKEDKLLKEED